LDTEPRVIANTDSEAMEFVQSFDDNDDDEAARRRHSRNTDTAESDDAVPKPIIPTPLRLVNPAVKNKVQVHIDSDWTVVYDGKRLHNEAAFIAGK